MYYPPYRFVASLQLKSFFFVFDKWKTSKTAGNKLYLIKETREKYAEKEGKFVELTQFKAEKGSL